MKLIPDEPYLIDEWPDAYIDSNAWVAITPQTITPALAIDFLYAEVEEWMDDCDGFNHFVVTGWSFQRRVGHEVEGTDYRSEHPLDHYGPCRTCGGRKKYTVIDKIELRSTAPASPAERLAAGPGAKRFEGLSLTGRNEEKVITLGGVITARHDEECDDCHGTGKEADWIDGDEGWPYERCGVDDEGAVLYWNLERSEHPGPHHAWRPVNKKVSDDQITLAL